MPEIFPFIPGNESSRLARQHSSDASPLLGRFRAVPRGRRSSSSQLGLLLNGGGGGGRGGSGSVHVGYGVLVAAGLAADEADGDFDDDEDEEEDGGRAHWTRRAWRRAERQARDLWVAPRQSAVKRVVEKWWSRWGCLIVLPAALAVAWAAVPFPQKHLRPGDADLPPPEDDDAPTNDRSSPGHGAARVQVNFWFFLLVYYGFYNLTALIWITKVFNLYSLNWWPQTLGFPLTVSLIALVSIAAPVPVYLSPELRWLTVHNTAWISWTFVIMAMPVAIAFGIMMTHERHLGLRHSLSETQRIFTSSWWTNEPEAGGSWSSDWRRRSEPSGPNNGGPSSLGGLRAFLRRRWLPSSFVRFVWFCLALSVGLLAYLMGEAYAEIYLRTLPHNNLETVVYVYSWVVTVHLLDALTGWILGISEGERVGSYPLSWIFKLYFMLTYQTYVRALYARLRSPSQFVMLQILSSSSLIILVPLTMTSTYHRLLVFLGLSGQTYAAYQKVRIRDVFIRFLAENVSMLAFLGSILVLHFGANQDVYPYFAFDEPGEPYDFALTFYAAGITWGCELVAAIVLRGLIRWCFGVNAGVEGMLDLAVWPELLPTSVAVMVHCLQNMLFSIIRLHFH